MLGSAPNAPLWFVEISLMEQFHWDEEQLYDKVSWKRIQQISEYNRIKSMVEEQNARKQRAQQSGQRVVSETYHGFSG